MESSYVVFILLSLILLPNHSLWLASANLEGSWLLNYSALLVSQLLSRFFFIWRWIAIFSVCIL